MKAQIFIDCLIGAICLALVAIGIIYAFGG